MANQIKAGVIGLGIMGRQHSEALHGHPDAKLVAVADIRAQIAEDLGARLGARPYGDYEAMLKSQALDVVVVATPDPWHRAPVLAATRAGIPNIVLEKPFATTMADAHEMYEAVEAKGTRLFMNFSNRTRSLEFATRYVLREGLIGDVVYGEMRTDDNIAVPTAMWGERSKQWAGDSSVAHFLLSHTVDLLRWYFSPAEVTEVYAISQREVLGYTPDVFDAFLTFDSGLKVRVNAGWIKHIDSLVEAYVCFSGREGTLIFNKLPGFGVEGGWRTNLSPRVDSSSLLAHQQLLQKRGINVSAVVHRPALVMGRLTAGGDDMKLALEMRGLPPRVDMPMWPHFVNAILEGKAEPSSWEGSGPLPNHLDGLKQTQVVAAIGDSAGTGKPIELD